MPVLTEMSMVMVLAMLLKFPSVGKRDEVVGERDGPMRYMFYPSSFILSIICYLKQNLKEVSVHLS